MILEPFIKRQIKLLSTVKYWYVMPIVTGYFALHGYGIYETLQANGDINSHLISIAIMAAIGVFPQSTYIIYT